MPLPRLFPPRAEPVTLLPYQDAAARFLACRRRGLVQSPAGSGKTIIAAAALKRVVLSRARLAKVRVGWIANTLEQCQQARDAIAKFPDLAAAIETTICCPAGAPEHWEMDVIVGDEAHHFGGARTWIEIADAHKGCLWLLTATPFGDDPERNAKLRALCEDQIHVVPREAVAARVVPAHVHLLTDTDPGLKAPIDAEIQSTIAKRRKFSKLSYEDLYRQVASHVAITLGVVANCARNAAVVRVAQRHAADSVLILVPQIEHGQALSAELPGSVVCFSKMGATKRREAIADFRAGSLKCLIATSLADEGLDVPVANVLILAGAGRSAKAAEQRTGRVLRSDGAKTHGTIYDFADHQHGLLENQSKARQAVYRRLGYTIHGEQGSLAL